MIFIGVINNNFKILKFNLFKIIYCKGNTLIYPNS